METRPRRFVNFMHHDHKRIGLDGVPGLVLHADQVADFPARRQLAPGKQLAPESVSRSEEWNHPSGEVGEFVHSRTGVE